MMIDLDTYLQYNSDPDLYASHQDEIIEYNKALVEKYPWIIARDLDEETGIYSMPENVDYTYTVLDDLPCGWRKAFGIQLVEEVGKVLEEEDLVNQYEVNEVKEKFGTLRWYDSRISRRVDDILDKYEELSSKTCVNCGKPAKWRTNKGWICPYCDDCRKKFYSKYTDEAFTKIGE